VETVRADRYGGLEIQMTSGYALKVFPNFSRAREHWRFFDVTNADDRHFVVLPNEQD
jgi:hypothetical protein